MIAGRVLIGCTSSFYRAEQEDLLKNILGENWDVDKNREHALAISQQENPG
jgi:hypothetical protein